MCRHARVAQTGTATPQEKEQMMRRMGSSGLAGYSPQQQRLPAPGVDAMDTSIVQVRRRQPPPMPRLCFVTALQPPTVSA
jgi:hypothetical protein